MRRFGTSCTIFWRFFFYLISPSLLFKMRQYLATGKIENKIQLVNSQVNTPHNPKKIANKRFIADLC